MGVGGAKEKRQQELPHYTARASPRGGRVALVCPSGACGALGSSGTAEVRMAPTREQTNNAHRNSHVRRPLDWTSKRKEEEPEDR